MTSDWNQPQPARRVYVLRLLRFWHLFLFWFAFCFSFFLLVCFSVGVAFVFCVFVIQTNKLFSRLLLREVSVCVTSPKCKGFRTVTTGKQGAEVPTSLPLPTKLGDVWQGYRSGTPDLRTCFCWHGCLRAQIAANMLTKPRALDATFLLLLSC